MWSGFLENTEKLEHFARAVQVKRVNAFTFLFLNNVHRFRLNADQLKEADRKISVFMLHVIKASESTMGGIEVVLLGVYNKHAG